MVMCHIPVHPDTCQNQHLLWNYDEVTMTGHNVPTFLPGAGRAGVPAWHGRGGLRRPRPRGWSRAQEWHVARHLTKVGMSQSVTIRYLPSLQIQIICTVCTASCRM